MKAQSKLIRLHEEKIEDRRKAVRFVLVHTHVNKGKDYRKETNDAPRS